MSTEFELLDSNNYTTSTDIPDAMTIHPDGDVFYTGFGSRWMKQYDLSTPWDFSTATYTDTGEAELTGGGNAFPQVMYMHPSGTSIFIFTNSYVYQFSFGTAKDITSLTHINSSAELPYFYGPGYGTFSDDGTVMYRSKQIFLGTTTLGRYTLSTPWDISTIAFDSEVELDNEYDVPNIAVIYGGLRLVFGDGDYFYIYDLAAPNALPSATETSNTYVAGYDQELKRAIVANAGNTILYAVGVFDVDAPQYDIAMYEHFLYGEFPPDPFWTLNHGQVEII